MLSRPLARENRSPCMRTAKSAKTDVALGCKWNAERNKCESANELDVGGFSARRTRQAMTAFLVKRYIGGWRRVEAETEIEAAERICGGPLSVAPRPMEFCRAEV